MVEISYNTPAYLLRQIYDRTKSRKNDLLDGVVVNEYFGDINENSISTIIDDVEHKLIQNIEQRTTSIRIFAIFVEGLQNIYKHGRESEGGKHMGASLLVKTKDAYRIHFFNVSPKSEILVMSEYLDYLNGLSMDETKKFYMKRLVNCAISERGGASLGYIIMKLKSNNNIKYSFEAADESNSCYHIEIVLEIPIK